MNTILNLASGVASLCTIAVTLLPIFKKIFPSGTANRKEKKLFEEVHSLRRAEETLRKSDARFENESIHEATQKEVRDRLILYLAQKKYPRDQRWIYELSAWLGFAFTILFWVSLILPLFSKNNSEFHFSWPVFVWSALSWGLMSACLGYLVEENRCLTDYMVQLRSSSSPLTPRRPGDKHSDAKEIDKNVSDYKTTFWACSIPFALTLLVFLFIFPQIADTQFEPLTSNQWRATLLHLACWIAGSGVVTALLGAVYSANLRSRIFSWVKKPIPKFTAPSFFKAKSQKGKKNES